jgi:hypothetical protein
MLLLAVLVVLGVIVALVIKGNTSLARKEKEKCTAMTPQQLGEYVQNKKDIADLKRRSPFAVVFLVLAAFFVVFLMLLHIKNEATETLNAGYHKKVSDDPLQAIKDQVAKDAVDEYWIAAKSGSSVDRCVQAGIVTAAYLQAKDEDNYSSWKVMQRRDCTDAGVPQ